MQRLSLERDRVAVVHANRACVLADGAGVTEGRKAVNFSEWAAYPPDAAANAAGRVVRRRDERQDAWTLHAGAS